ncbi:QRFP-like peptide receptor [Haliotis rufescens]|uniref:QRFP-like peptide receptor n=1 Tax=Haliotis rufescens TaxID=6454 RepID=UPI00201ED683|nr:QRFP-like peptide receptor [Haliotis rufescens]
MANTTLQTLVKEMYGNTTLPPAVTTPFYPPEFHRLNAVSTFLNVFYIWVIFVIGCPGNVVCVVVIINMSKQRLTTSFFYVAVLSIVDNLTIILKIIENQSRQMRFSIDETGCQFLFFFGLTFAAFANWILIILSAERFTAVAFPMRVGLIWSLKKAVGILVGVFLFLGLIHSHIFATVTHYESYTCTVKETFHQHIFPFWFFTSATIYAFLPATCLIIFNILIILSLRRYSEQRQHMLSQCDPAQMEARRQERQVTIMLVTLSVVFLILTIPRCVCVILYNQLCSDDKDFMCNARRGLFNAITTQIADTNHAINFYLYFLSGRRFRKQFLKLFRCGRVTYTEVSNETTHVFEIPIAESGI